MNFNPLLTIPIIIALTALIIFLNYSLSKLGNKELEAALEAERKAYRERAL